jgi:predicted naringenin-chalcone synthase
MHVSEPTTHPATIAATATAVPPHILTREDVKTYMRRVFDVGARRLDAIMTVIDNAQVHQRHSIFPIEYLVEPRPLAQTSREYQEHAVRLGWEAAEACLVNASMTPHDIDLIITVSCTGFMIPSLDAHLINLMGFRPDVRRRRGVLRAQHAEVRPHPDQRAANVSALLALLPRRHQEFARRKSLGARHHLVVSRRRAALEDPVHRPPSCARRRRVPDRADRSRGDPHR